MVVPDQRQQEPSPPQDGCAVRHPGQSGGSAGVRVEHRGVGVVVDPPLPAVVGHKDGHDGAQPGTA